MAKHPHHFSKLTMQIKLLNDVLGVSPSGAELLCLPIMFDITGDFGGSTAQDLSRISGLPYPSVMRYIKSFLKAGLINYEKLHEGDRNKYITLTEKGQDLKVRVFRAETDARTSTLVDMQEDARNEALVRGHDIQMARDAAAKKAAETGNAEKVDYTLKADKGSYELKADPIEAAVGMVGKATVKVSASANAEVIKSADGPTTRKRTVKEQLDRRLVGRTLLKRLEELEVADDDHVMTQVLRAVRTSAPSATSATWRGETIKKVKPRDSLLAFQSGEYQRIQNQGVWMLYEHGDNPATSLPVGVQIDFAEDEFAELMAEQTNLLTAYEIVQLGDITFGGVMKDMKALLNAKQYNRARNTLTKAVADISTTIARAQEEHEAEVKLMNERAKAKAARADAMRSHANHPSISQSERLDLMREAHEAEGDKALAEASAEATTDDLKKLQEQMAAMQAMLNKLTAEKDDDDA